MERSLVLVKPDGVQRALVGEVISRLERRGLRLVAAKFMQVSNDLAETHYGIHKGKPFYEGLISYITSRLPYFLSVYGNWLQSFISMSCPPM